MNAVSFLGRWQWTRQTRSFLSSSSSLSSPKACSRGGKEQSGGEERHLRQRERWNSRSKLTESRSNPVLFATSLTPEAGITHWNNLEITMVRAMSWVCLLGTVEKLESPLCYNFPMCFFYISGRKEHKSFFILAQIFKQIFQRQLFGSVWLTYVSLSMSIINAAGQRCWLGLEGRPLAKAAHLWQSGYRLGARAYVDVTACLVHFETPVEGEVSEGMLVYESSAMNSPFWVIRILLGVKSAPINWLL